MISLLFGSKLLVFVGNIDTIYMYLIYDASPTSTTFASPTHSFSFAAAKPPMSYTAPLPAIFDTPNMVLTLSIPPTLQLYWSMVTGNFF